MTLRIPHCLDDRFTGGGEVVRFRLRPSLPSREEHKLRVFENRVLRRMFCPKKDGVTRR
jgi:hypothetical protein